MSCRWFLFSMMAGLMFFCFKREGFFSFYELHLRPATCVPPGESFHAERMRNWQLTKASNCRRLKKQGTWAWKKENGRKHQTMCCKIIYIIYIYTYYITVVCHVICVFSPYYSVFFPFLKVVNKKPTNRGLMGIFWTHLDETLWHPMWIRHVQIGPEGRNRKKTTKSLPMMMSDRSKLSRVRILFVVNQGLDIH